MGQGSPQTFHQPPKGSAKTRVLLLGWVYSGSQDKPHPCPPRAYLLVAEVVMCNLTASGTVKKNIAG